MLEFSWLRLVAILAGVTFAGLGLRSLRSRGSARATIWMQLGVGLMAIAVGLFPALVNLPADLFSLGAIPGGRLITLLIVISGVLLQRVASISDSQARLRRDFGYLLQASMADAFSRRAGHEISPDSVMVILPCYNEADNLAELLPKVPSQVAGLPVVPLVVDDGSQDGSARVAERHGALVVSHPINMGGGRALSTGFGIAKAAGVRIVVTMDSDGQHDPAEIGVMIAPLIANEADVVVGSRALGQHDAASPMRSVGVVVFSALLSLLTGQHLTDCASGFRAFNASVLGRLRLRQEQYHTAEFIIEACKAGLRIAERPITIRLRQHGVSKKGHDMLYGYRFAKAVAKSWLQ
jgi:hypothetical protein